MSHSGVEPTITGVLFGALVPMWAYYDPRRVHARGEPLLLEASRAAQSEPLDIPDYEHVGAGLREVSRLIRESTSPVERVLTRTAPWVSFVILPVFALANAGVRLDFGALTGPETRVALGVGVGLVIGKPIGIILASALAVRLRVGRLPSDTTWSVLAAVGVTAGVGFTVALYVADIAFLEPGLRNSARMGILGGSLVAAVCGVAAMSIAVRHRPHEKEPSHAP
jgi:NhaA family Na+:H+ antiporter